MSSTTPPTDPASDADDRAGREPDVTAMSAPESEWIAP